jgi:hypothetical protein
MGHLVGNSKRNDRCGGPIRNIPGAGSFSQEQTSTPVEFTAATRRQPTALYLYHLFGTKSSFHLKTYEMPALRRYSKYESYKKFGGIFVVRDGMKSSAGGEELHLTVCFIDPISRSDLYAPHPVHLTTAYLCGWVQASAARGMTAALFWTFTQRVVAIPYRLFGTSMTLKMGTVVCPETSVRNYHFSLRNNPVERSSHYLLVSCSSQKTCDAVWSGKC